MDDFLLLLPMAHENIISQIFFAFQPRREGESFGAQLLFQITERTNDDELFISNVRQQNMQCALPTASPQAECQSL